ncbi:hypothetical protein GCM10023322_49400 [Rugosimonospora acidiphila]|uniref:Uncharacterized protein n=1 Tax=Rugosimonospora acidiphila TaxID=556531 RepID=A0ABP9S7T2_9ACTN
MTEPVSYSISVRLRRVTAEEGYVSVPVTDAVMSPEPDQDGNLHLDPEKLWAEAIRLGSRLDTWRIEERDVTPHPIQKAPEGVFESGTDASTAS